MKYFIEITNAYVRREMRRMESISKNHTFTVTADRIRKMAEKCPQTRAILKEGFPEAFEEIGGYFKAGSWFFAIDKFKDDKYWDSKDSTLFNSIYDFHFSNFPLSEAMRFMFILGHGLNSREYVLFNLYNGYPWKRGHVYNRKDKGIFIPGEDLKGLSIMREGGGK